MAGNLSSIKVILNSRLGAPVYGIRFRAYLVDIGENTKTVDEEMLRQLRQNNGTTEMLLPLASVSSDCNCRGYRSEESGTS